MISSLRATFDGFGNRWNDSAGLKRGLALAFVAIVLSACGKAPEKPADALPRPNLAQVGVKYDLAEYFPVAEVHGDVKRLVPGMPGSERFFTAGWNKAEVTATSESFAWTTTRDAVVEIPRVHPEDFRIALDLLPHPPGPRLPPQRVSVVWNGDVITTRTLAPGRQSVEVEIPAARQHCGMNRLEFLPGYWIRPKLLGMGNDNRDLGVRCFGINLAGPKGATVPQPDPWLALVDGGSIRQKSGSVVGYAFALPLHARISGELTLRTPDDSKEKLSGRVVLALRADGSDAERRIIDAPMETLAGAGIRIDAELEEESGRMATITLACWTDAVAPARLEVEWKDVKIEGTREELAGEGVEKMRGRYNILLVLFDSLRADEIEPYGAREVKTPSLAQLAAEGVTFTNARSNAPWTAPSVASMFTSRYPAEHGIKSFGNRFPDGMDSLPELLRRAGYQTTAIVNNVALDSTLGFARGFDRFDEYFKLHDEKARSQYRKPEDHAGFVWNQYIAPRLDAARDAPFFVYLHELDPHMPYLPMPPFDTLYGRGGKSAIQQDRVFELQGIHGVPGILRPQDVEQLHALYRGEITYMDRYLGHILGKLEERGLGANTLVLFVSDHGEEFFEHGRLGHGYNLYEELLRVPMVLRLKGVFPPGRRPAYDAQLTDLAPTLLDLIGEKIPPGMRGRSLLSLLAGPESHRPVRTLHATSMDATADWVGFGPWKLTRDNSARRVDHPPHGFKLFNTDDDPQERTDVWPSEPIVGLALRQMLLWQHLLDRSRSVAKGEGAEPAPMDPETVKRLRALGYLN